MRRRTFLKTSGAGALSLLAGPRGAAAEPEARPNIVWIIAEDMSCHFGYQGEPLVNTPHVDRLAREGAVFDSVYTTCPVCSPSRSAMITGMYQTTIGAHNHRSFRGEVKHALPAPARPVPEYFKAAGYYVCNGSRSEAIEAGKTDYNFTYPDDLYDGTDYTGAAPDQPIFMQFQLQGGKFRRAKVEHEVAPDAVKLPPYYPDDPVLRENWASYLNSVMYVDQKVGRIMARLEADGRADNTVVFLPRIMGSATRGANNSFTKKERVFPLLCGRPAAFRRKPLGMNWSRKWTSQPRLSILRASRFQPTCRDARCSGRKRARDYVVSARDRCDETVERLRSVRKGTFTYIRNFYPERPHMQPNAYKDGKPIVIRLRELHAEGKLSGHPAERLFVVPRPREELYDRETDPWELTNLADDPAHAETLAELRGILDKWIHETNDQGQTPEPESVYDADLAVYLKSRNDEPEYLATMQRNIAQMKAWAREGK